MRKLFYFFVCLSCLQIIFASCCQLEPPPYGYSVVIDLLDKNTGRSLIASRDSIYYPDSIELQTINPSRSYRMAVNARDTILRSEFVFPEGSYRNTFYFRYRTGTIDTLVISFHDETGRACGERFKVLEIDKAIVNGTVACEPCNDFREPLLIRK
jgi:hypothetical protein